MCPSPPTAPSDVSDDFLLQRLEPWAEASVLKDRAIHSRLGGHAFNQTPSRRATSALACSMVTPGLSRAIPW